MKYRKKPIVIEAFCFDGDLIASHGGYYVPDWAAEAHQRGELYYDSFEDGPPCDLFIKTLEGHMHVQVGDYVIQGVKGEIYPCKPDIFEATYEKVEKEK